MAIGRALDRAAAVSSGFELGPADPPIRRRAERPRRASSQDAERLEADVVPVRRSRAPQNQFARSSTPQGRTHSISFAPSANRVPGSVFRSPAAIQSGLIVSKRPRVARAVFPPIQTHKAPSLRKVGQQQQFAAAPRNSLAKCRSRRRRVMCGPSLFFFPPTHSPLPRACLIEIARGSGGRQRPFREAKRLRSGHAKVSASLFYTLGTWQARHAMFCTLVTRTLEPGTERASFVRYARNASGFANFSLALSLSLYPRVIAWQEIIVHIFRREGVNGSLSAALMFAVAQGKKEGDGAVSHHHSPRKTFLLPSAPMITTSSSALSFWRSPRRRARRVISRAVVARDHATFFAKSVDSAAICCRRDARRAGRPVSRCRVPSRYDLKRRQRRLTRRDDDETSLHGQQTRAPFHVRPL